MGILHGGANTETRASALHEKGDYILLFLFVLVAFLLVLVG
jgi:hypothetical protein